MPTALPAEAINHLAGVSNWLNEPAPYDPVVPPSGRRTYTISLQAWRLVFELVKPVLMSLGKDPQKVDFTVQRIVSRTILTFPRPFIIIPIQIIKNEPYLDPGGPLALEEMVYGNAGNYAIEPELDCVVVIER